MLRNLFSILAIASVTQVCAVANACESTVVLEQAEGLRRLSKAIESDPSTEAHTRFFEALPTSFDCYGQIFGYPGPLYDERDMFQEFTVLSKVVPPHDFVSKLVSLSINARWDADQINALQNVLRDSLEAHTPIFIDCVSALTSDAEASVWRFLFDAPHPSNEPLSSSLSRSICFLSARSCALSASAFQAGLAQEELH